MDKKVINILKATVEKLEKPQGMFDKISAGRIVPNPESYLKPKVIVVKPKDKK